MDWAHQQSALLASHFALVATGELTLKNMTRTPLEPRQPYAAPLPAFRNVMHNLFALTIGRDRGDPALPSSTS
jgi:hypothetical protein